MRARKSHSEDQSKIAIITKVLMYNGANIHDLTNDGQICTNFAASARINNVRNI